MSIYKDSRFTYYKPTAVSFYIGLSLSRYERFQLVNFLTGFQHINVVLGAIYC